VAWVDRPDKAILQFFHNRHPSPRGLNRTKISVFEIGSKRTVFTGTPVRIEHALTGPERDLIPVMFAMTKFSMKNFPEEVFEDGKGHTPEQVIREVRVSRGKGQVFDFP
jgi:hypothetical protein